jgi:hypothetical protein
MDMLPNTSPLKQQFNQIQKTGNKQDLVGWVQENLQIGSIDVNIMTKLDKENYSANGKLPSEYNDAHAALRGFAKSKLNSSIVLSAGLNQKLYSYMENFDDFYPDENGRVKKKIILKVSDYRSALVQGRFLAKKGLWISEYRIESGLNCGGHAFATHGYLMGPILEEFKNNRHALVDTMFEVLLNALKNQHRICPQKAPDIKVTAQGGVGTSEEHEFLLNHYLLDSIGWGTPFLLVPEVVNVDPDTLRLLSEALEGDLYLSNISPLGIPFNNLRGNTKDVVKEQRIKDGTPGSPCAKKFLVSNTEFTEKPVCTASRQFQSLKLDQLLKKTISPEERAVEYNKIVEKSCICVGLGTAALMINNLDSTLEGKGVSVCPGPNLAYFSKIVPLKEMIDHIYGRINLISRKDRPHMFINELKMYIDYLKNKIEEASKPASEKQKEYIQVFQQNLKEGIRYYNGLFTNIKMKCEESKASILKELEIMENAINCLMLTLV